MASTRYSIDSRIAIYINTNPFILWTPVEAPRDTIVMLNLVGSIGS